MPDPSDLVERLAQHRTLSGVPRTELEWLVAHGELVRMEPGDLLTKVPRMVESLSILLSGHFAIYVDHGAGPHKVMEWAGGDVSGFLPYSRMGKPPGETVIDEAGDVVLVNVRHFPEMIRECSAVTTRLVHVMLDRARQFRSSELQDEKMLSLGKLSAGLAHELNNPASAAALGAARLDAAQLAAVANTRVACAAAAPAALAPLARADREDAIADWLVEHGADANAAAPLADTGVTIQSLDALAAKLDRGTLNVALRWVAAGCTTRALAADVERAATRIHKLVGAIKRFTYMDRAQVPEPVDVVESLNDSLALVLHKARKKSIGVEVSSEPDLPPALAIGGDLNQIWTNLIDNAIDAVSESGRVIVSASRYRNCVVVRIEDNGCGIPDDIRDRIFDPFVTSKPVGQGTGLGLNIARQLIRRNNGDIEVESQPGRTEFRVTLPTAAGAVSNA
jgi:signal transduction histidine kinase